jgi:hypothetical protein
MLSPDARAPLGKKEFSVRRSDQKLEKIGKKVTLDENSNSGPPIYGMKKEAKNSKLNSLGVMVQFYLEPFYF